MDREIDGGEGFLITARCQVLIGKCGGVLLL